MRRHAEVFRDQVQPVLADENITIVHWEDLAEKEQIRLHKFFRKQIFPVLTPLAVDPAHPFPYISGLSLNLAVVVANPVTGKEHFARVKVPPLLPRFIAVDDRGRPSAPTPTQGGGTQTSFVPLEEVIAHHLDHLFPGMEVREHHTFRVTRNEDVESRRTTPRTCSRRWRRSCCGAGSARRSAWSWPRASRSASASC